MMGNIQVGKAFPSNYELADHVQIYSIRQLRRGVCRKKLDNEQVLLTCAASTNLKQSKIKKTCTCPGKVRAKPVHREDINNKIYPNREYFVITEVIEHTCSEQDHRQVSDKNNSSKKFHPYVIPKTDILVRILTPMFSLVQNFDIKHVRGAIGHLLNWSDEDTKFIPYSTVYTTYQLMKINIYGDCSHQFATIIHRLELMKKYDPDSTFRIKLYEDTIKASELEEIDRKIIASRTHKPKKKSKKKRSRSTDTDDCDDSYFALRFGAIAICPGTSFRRSLINADIRRRVNSVDATHLYSYLNGTLSDIIEVMADGEILPKSMCIDSLNECKEHYHFHLELHEDLGLQVYNNEQGCKPSIVSDRLKGQDDTFEKIYGDQLRLDKCIYHLKENLFDKGMNRNLEKLFDRVVYSSTQQEYEQNLELLLAEVSPNIAQYINTSIFTAQNVNYIVDFFKMQQENKEIEGMRSSQPSESYHKAIKDFRFHLFPCLVTSIYNHNYQLHRNLRNKYNEINTYLPPTLTREYQNVFPIVAPIANYTRRFENGTAYIAMRQSPHKVHEISIIDNKIHCNRRYVMFVLTFLFSNTKITCICFKYYKFYTMLLLRCQERNGRICAEGLAEINELERNYEDFVHPKYTVESTREIINRSIGDVDVNVN